MKLVKSKTLFDGISERNDLFIGFEDDEIKYVGSNKPAEEGGNSSEIIAEADTITPGFIDSHSHIGMARSGEPSKEEEANEQMKTIYPLVNSLHSIYMDNTSFSESVEMVFFILQYYQVVVILLAEKQFSYVIFLRILEKLT